MVCGRLTLVSIFVFEKLYESEEQNYYCLCNIFRNHQTATSFRYIQQSPVQEIRQRGARGHLQSTVPKVKATCVFQMKTSQNSQSSVTLTITYLLRKVKIVMGLIKVCRMYIYDIEQSCLSIDIFKKENLLLIQKYIIKRLSGTC